MGRVDAVVGADSGTSEAVVGVVVTGSPHHVEQAEDDDPQQIDHVPVGCARFDHGHPAAAWVAQVAHHDPEDDEPNATWNRCTPVSM